MESGAPLMLSVVAVKLSKDSEAGADTDEGACAIIGPDAIGIPPSRSAAAHHLPIMVERFLFISHP